jgi:hypothetical protein
MDNLYVVEYVTRIKVGSFNYLPISINQCISEDRAAYRLSKEVGTLKIQFMR